VQEVVEQEKQSIARVCRVIELDRSMFYYESKKDDSAVEQKLQEYVVNLPNRGFKEYFKRIRKEGLIWNHKRVKRVYKKLGLAKRRRVKRRKLYPNPSPKNIQLFDLMDAKTVNLYNATGQLLQKIELRAEQSYVFANVQVGIYFVEVVMKDHELFKYKAIVR